MTVGKGHVLVSERVGDLDGSQGRAAPGRHADPTAGVDAQATGVPWADAQGAGRLEAAARAALGSLHVPLGSDRRVARRSGHRHREGKDGTDIAYPTSMVVDADGKVRWIYQSNTYRQRARPKEVLAAIAALDGGGH